MPFYKVKPGREIQVNGVSYPAGQLVELTTQQANYHTESIILNDYPVQDSAAVANFYVPKGADFFHTIGLGTKTLEVTGWTMGNPIVIQTEAAHGLTTGLKVWIHAFRFTNLNKDVLISNAYIVTRLTADTFSIPLDGTNFPVPDFGYVDYLEDISDSAFECKIYEPKRKIKIITNEAYAGCTLGEPFLKLKGAKDPVLGLRKGQKITVEGAFNGAEILAIGDETGNQEAALVLSSPATGTVEGVYWYASEEYLDPSEIGTSLGNMTLTVDTALSQISIAYYASDSITLKQYLFKIFETKNGTKDVILKGLLIYE